MDFALMPSFIPTFTTACDQASKLGLGRNKTIISMYSNYQVGVCARDGCVFFVFHTMRARKHAPYSIWNQIVLLLTNFLPPLLPTPAGGPNEQIAGDFDIRWR